MRPTGAPVWRKLLHNNGSAEGSRSAGIFRLLLLWCCFAILELKKKGSTIYYGLTLTTLIGYKLLYKCSFHQQIGNYLLFSISEELGQVSLNQAILVIDLGVGSYPAWELVQGIGEGKPEKRKKLYSHESKVHEQSHLPRCYTRSPTATVRDRFCWNQASPAALGDQHMRTAASCILFH